MRDTIIQKRTDTEADTMKTAVFDIGGTAIKYGVFEAGKLFSSGECPTEAQLGGMSILGKVKSVIREFSKEYKIDRIGISTAGQVDSDKGVIKYANPNIPDYTGLRIKEILTEEFNIPVAVENDVNAAAIGEAVHGAGKNTDDFLLLAYGTGIGGAIFADGKIYHGSGYSAGEMGAIITHPEDRNPDADIMSGCYERYASSTALVKLSKEYDTTLTNGRVIFERFDDEKVKKIIDEWIDEVVFGLASVVHIFNPSAIILGGGIMEQDYIIEEVEKRLKTNIMESFRNVLIKKAMLGNKAGLFGAAQLFD